MYGKRRKQNDKYLRLTGMWESKKQGLFTGKLRPEDVAKLIEKAEEADKAEVPLVFFLWENKQESRKDPVFTLQVTVAEDDGGRSRGRSRSSGRSRDEDEDEDEDKPRSRKRADEDEQDDPEPEEDEKEDKPRRAKKPTKSTKPAKEDW